MAKKPLVSIITPSFNQGKFLKQTIQSITNQDYQNIEYIIIDGGSTDNSVDIIRKHRNKISYWVSEPDRGQAHAINKGLSIANGEIVGWLNADDLLLPKTVSLIIQAFRENPHVDVVYGHLDRIDENGKLIHTPTLPKDKVEFSRQLIVGECIVNQPGSFWRKQMIEKVGYLDESLHYGLDYDYWIRIAIAGGAFKKIPNTVAQFRISKDSKTIKETEKMAIEQLKILNRVLSSEDLSRKTGLSRAQIAQQARKTRSVICLYIFYGYFKKKSVSKAGYWLFQALKYNPLVVFQRRWLALVLARLSRRFTSSKYS